jgi:hypothetical protein
MALERFIPKSPDIFIRNSQDFEVAKFGHLNTIVEYINNNSAKPAGLNGYVQFNNNSALGGDAGLFWDNVNKRLGIGTVTPSSTLIVNGVTGITNSLYLGNTDSFLSTNRFQILNAANSAIMVNVDNGGSISTTGRFQIFNSARTAIAQAMYYDGGTMVFRPMNDGVESTSFRNNAQTLNILNFNGVNGNVDLNFTGASLGAKLGIRGSGSTSATTSLLVQNSSANESLRILDDGKVYIGSNSMSVSGIYIPRDASFGSRTFLYNQDNVGLMQTVSNDQLRILRYCYFSEPINIQGVEIRSSSNGSYDFTGGLNPSGSSDGAQLNLNGNGRLQGSSFGKHIRIQGTMQLDNAANKLWGFYYNPTLTGAYSNQNVFAFQSTYGGGYFNTATPQASAILQADSTTQGFLPPRMTTAQRLAIASPAASLIVFDTDVQNLCYRRDGVWVQATFAAV